MTQVLSKVPLFFVTLVVFPLFAALFLVKPKEAGKFLADCCIWINVALQNSFCLGWQILAWSILLPESAWVKPLAFKVDHFQAVIHQYRRLADITIFTI